MADGTYSDLLLRIKALAGVSDFTDTELTFMNSLVNRRANAAYEATDYWPRYLVVGEKRTLSTPTVTAAAIEAGNTYTILTVGTTNFVSIGASANTVGVVFVATATPSPAGTGTASLSTNIVPFTQAGKSTIDTFLRIHKTYQPFYLYSAPELEYYVTYEGAYLVGDTAPSTNTYVTYKKVADAAYTSASTNIPGEWFNYLAHASFADFLRQDGQNEKAVLEENIAKGILDDQLQKTDVSRATGMIGHRISTHNSRSFRR
jgi:hypothetical protein